jgi:hypothetical protein
MTSMGVMSKVADTFRMTDDAWQRHANPWSVWTRFAAIPLMILAIWSRVWLCLVPGADRCRLGVAMAESARLRAGGNADELDVEGHLR